MNFKYRNNNKFIFDAYFILNFKIILHKSIIDLTLELLDKTRKAFKNHFKKVLFL